MAFFDKAKKHASNFAKGYGGVVGGVAAVVAGLGSGSVEATEKNVIDNFSELEGAKVFVQVDAKKLAECGYLVKPETHEAVEKHSADMFAEMDVENDKMESVGANTMKSDQQCVDGVQVSETVIHNGDITRPGDVVESELVPDYDYDPNSSEPLTPAQLLAESLDHAKYAAAREAAQLSGANEEPTYVTAFEVNNDIREYLAVGQCKGKVAINDDNLFKDASTEYVANIHTLASQVDPEHTLPLSVISQGAELSCSGSSMEHIDAYFDFAVSEQSKETNHEHKQPEQEVVIDISEIER